MNMNMNIESSKILFPNLNMCNQCGCHLYYGDTAYCADDGPTYCSEDCVRKYAEENQQCKRQSVYK